MEPVQSALLFVNAPSITFETLITTLDRRAAFLDQTFVRELTTDSDQLGLTSKDYQISIAWGHSTLPDSSFYGALDNLISEPFDQILSAKVNDHAHYLVISVNWIGETARENIAQTRLQQLQMAHVITTLMAEWHQPQAVHWRASNQLLTGAQYLTTATERTPWALFVRATLDANSRSLHLTGTDGLCGDFVIQIDQTTIALDKAHAISLAFLREVITDGASATTKSFQASTGDVVLVHQAPAQDPEGRIVLRLVPWRTAQEQIEPVAEPFVPAAGIDRLKSALGDIEPARAPDHTYQAKWLSYIMMLLMPPLGLALMISNTLLGPSLFRSGIMTLGSLTLAMLVFSGLSMSGNAKLTAWTTPSPTLAEIHTHSR